MASRYWVGNGGNWSETTHWAEISGGSGGFSVPSSLDNVYFDTNSFTIDNQILTISGDIVFKNIDWSLINNTVVWSGTGDIGCGGNFILNDLLTINLLDSDWKFGTRMPGLISNNVFNLDNATFSINPNIIGWSLESSATLDILSDINLSTTYLLIFANDSGGSATFNTNNYTFDIAGIEAYGLGALFGSVGHLILNSGTSIFNIYIQDATSYRFKGIEFGLPNAIGAQGLITNNINQSTFNIYTSVNTKCSIWMAQQSGGTGMGNINIYNDGGIQFWGVNCEETLLITPPSISEKTFDFLGYNTFDILNINGSYQHIIKLRLPEYHVPPYTIIANVASLSYLDVKDCTAMGAAIPFDDTDGGIDSGNNTNWIFSFPINNINWIT